MIGDKQVGIAPRVRIFSRGEISQCQKGNVRTEGNIGYQGSPAKEKIGGAP